MRQKLHTKGEKIQLTKKLVLMGGYDYKMKRVLCPHVYVVYASCEKSPKRLLSFSKIEVYLKSFKGTFRLIIV